jgi:WhiB family transcriptional regulator, redox-sensing transcriptional regulator
MQQSPEISLNDHAMVVNDLSWMAQGQCRGHGELFYSPLFERPVAREIRESAAKAYCDVCVVQELCRLFGRVNHEYGFWGGENEAERVAAGFRLNAPVGVRVRRRNAA